MYKVFIRCYTFNQAQYIEDAMNGFVMQETDFPFVAAIVDDASTDETPQVITSYFERCFDTDDSSVAFREEMEYGTVLFARHRTNPNCFFAVILLRENHHKKKSKRPYLTRWTKDVSYVALCEGDDYWTDPRKLQKQVEYLDGHKDCSLCVHASNWLIGDELHKVGYPKSVASDLEIKELIEIGASSFATASFVFKSELNGLYPEWRKKANVGDFPLQILCGLSGVVHYLPDNMCVYRFQSRGSWSSGIFSTEASAAFHKNKIGWMTLLDKETSYSYQKEIYHQLFSSYSFLFTHGEIGFGEYALSGWKSKKFHKGRLIKDWLYMRFRPLFRALKPIYSKLKSK